MAVNNITDFYECSKKLDSLLVGLGYRKVVIYEKDYYYLGDYPELFVVNTKFSLIHFHVSFNSFWSMMDFYGDRPGSCKPNFELLATCANKLLIEYKKEILENKLKEIEKDFK